MSKNTGGPAFPHDEALNFETSTIVAPSTGMTLRDYFAAGVADGLSTATMPDGTWAHGDASDVAKRAFEIADAMIAERAK